MALCVIEGIDGSGKTHLARSLQAHIVGTGRDDHAVVLKRRPERPFMPRVGEALLR